MGENDNEKYKSTGAVPTDWQRSQLHAEADHEPYTSFPEPPQRKGECRFCKCLIFSFPCCCGYCLCLLLLGCAILLPLLFLKIAPDFAEASAQHSTITLHSAMMFNGDADHIEMEAQLDVHDAGMLNAVLEPTVADVYSPNGILMGTLGFPEVDVHSNVPTSIDMVSTFKCQNRAEFQNTVKEMIAGNSQTWTLKVKTTAKALGMSFKVNMDKGLTLPGLELINPTVTGIAIDHVTPDTAYAMGNFTFYTVSPMTLKGPRWCVFEIYNDANQKLGISNISYFNVSRGANRLDNLPMTMKQSDQLGLMMSKYLEGKDQNLLMVGPTSSSAPLLNGIVRQTILLKGSPDVTARNGLMDDNMLNGHTPSGGTLQRGARAAMFNAFNVPARIHDVVTDLFFVEPLPKVTLSHIGLSTQHCRGTNMYSRLWTGKGMNWTDENMDYVLLPPKTERDFFIIGGPIPGQEAGYNVPCKSSLGPTVFEHSCCFLAYQLAAACRSSARGSQFIASRMMANITATMYNNMDDAEKDQNGFSLSFEYTQDYFPVFFDNAVIAGFWGDKYIKCSDFTFG